MSGGGSIFSFMEDIACMRRLEDREQWLDHGLGCLTILPYYSFTYFLLLDVYALLFL
jgi:hypothetical protein